MNRNKTKAINSLFIFSSSLSLVDGEFKSLAIQARQAFSLRDYARQSLIASRLSQLPGRFGDWGQYHRALSSIRNGNGDVNKAALVMSGLSGSSDPALASLALVTLASIADFEGAAQESMRLAAEAVRTAGACDSPLPRMEAYNVLSLALSNQGEHERAFSVLKSIEPYARMVGMVYPAYAADYCNSLAVELGNLGKKDDAIHFSRIALANPISRLYPEWAETNQALLPPRQTSKTFTFASWLEPGESITYPAKKERLKNVSNLQPSTKQAAQTDNLAQLFPSSPCGEAIKTLNIDLFYNDSLLSLCQVEAFDLSHILLIVNSLFNLRASHATTTWLRASVGGGVCCEVPIDFEAIDSLHSILEQSKRQARKRQFKILKNPLLAVGE
jgi:tetratricopeptide (TPR) repeat protein